MKVRKSWTEEIPDPQLRAQARRADQEDKAFARFVLGFTTSGTLCVVAAVLIHSFA